MKIGLDASSIPAHVAGAGKYMCGLVNGFARIDSENEYVLFIKAGTQHLFPDLPDNFRVFALPDFSRPARILWQHWIAGRDGRACDLDVWHGLHYSLPRSSGPMHTVSTFHDLAFFMHPELFPTAKRLYFQRSIRRAWEVADAIISVSQSTADDARRCLEEATFRRHTHVIHSGLEERFFTVPSQEQIARVRRRYGLEERYILFVGTLEKRKNLPLLLAAFRHLRNLGHHELSLVLTGLPGNGHADVETIIARANSMGSILLPGYVPDDDILPLYHGAALFILPSVHEGFGFPLLEAMACGIPTLAADNSAMRELAGHSEMLCSGDAETWAIRMHELLIDPVLRQRTVARGVQRAREFTWERAARETLRVYESVIDGGQGPAQERKNSSIRSITVTTQSADRPAEINEAVLRTLAYADLFEYPLHLTEVHDGLLDCDATLEEVAAALLHWQTAGVIEQHDGVFFLRDRRRLVDMRVQRRMQTQLLLKKHEWLLRLVTKFPGVRSVSLSGAAAFDNCDEDDDLDVFIIAARRRVWSVYAGLVILLKLLRRRKTICVNCLFDQKHLRVDDRDFFLAHQIAFLRLYSGNEYFRQFQQANGWIYMHLPQRHRPAEEPAAAPHQPALQRLAEKFISFPFFDYIETGIYRLYRRRIRMKTMHLREDDVVIHPGQIRLFTNNHRHHLKAALERRLQEIAQRAQLTSAIHSGTAYESVSRKADTQITQAQVVKSGRVG